VPPLLLAVVVVSAGLPLLAAVPLMGPTVSAACSAASTSASCNSYWERPTT